MTLEEFPGYREALRAESEARDYAFLDLPRSICGIDVGPVTLRQLLARLALRCPFVADLPAETIIQFPDPAGEIGAFIWHISNARARSAGSRLDEHLARERLCKQLAFVSAEDAIAGIKEFLKITFLDAPGSGGKTYIPTASIAATLVDIFAAEYGWNEDRILDSAMVKLYQLLRERTLRLNPKAVLHNRLSDKIRGQYLKEANAHLFWIVPFDPDFATWQTAHPLSILRMTSRLPLTRQAINDSAIAKT
jgi:hypothetical protein